MSMKNLSSENVSKLVLICRLCGDATDSYINIFGQEAIKHSINEKILTHLKVEVSNLDLLPKIICNKCFQKLNEFHDFFLLSQKVQLLLKNTINESLFLVKINIELPGNETCSSNRNSTENDPTVYLFDDKKEKTETEKCFIYKEDLFSLTDKNIHDKEKQEITETIDTNKENVLENEKVDYDKILKINTTINNSNDSRCQDQDFINIKQVSSENNSVEFMLQNSENFVTPCYNDNNCIPMKLTEHSSELIYENVDNSLLESNELDTNKEVDSTMDTNSWMENYDKDSVWSIEDDLMDFFLQFPCTLCTQEFMCARKLIEHYNQRHHSSTPTFKCVICGRMYKALRIFYRHYEKHCSGNRHICEICGKSFTRNWTLRIHASVHSDAKPFNCDECGKKFKNLCSLKNHQKSHLPDECKLRYTCSFCGKSLKSKFVLTTHERTHTGQNDFICDTCGKSFASKSSLQTHISIHCNNKQINCPLCNKLIRTEKLFQRHLAYHSSKKQLKCDYCGKEFQYLNQLNEHIRLHTGELPFECEYCEKRFRLNSTLVIHRRQHTGVKPYKCKVCDHSFTNWPNYNKHMRRKHYNTIVKENDGELILLKI